MYCQKLIDVHHFIVLLLSTSYLQMTVVIHYYNLLLFLMFHDRSILLLQPRGRQELWTDPYWCQGWFCQVKHTIQVSSIISSAYQWAESDHIFMIILQWLHTKLFVSLQICAVRLVVLPQVHQQVRWCARMVCKQRCLSRWNAVSSFNPLGGRNFD